MGSFCIRCDQLDEVEIVLTDHVVRVKGTIPNLSLIELTVYADYVAALIVAALNLGSHTMRGNRRANNSAIVTHDWLRPERPR